jgi:hypothetical protein
VIYQSTQCHIPEDSYLHSHSSESLIEYEYLGVDSLGIRGKRHNNFFNIADLKTHIVKKVYDQCGDVASRYVLDHYHDWLLGGDGAVVVIDVYPDGYMTSTPPDKDGLKKKTQKKILCIADTSCMPARIWARIIQVVFISFFQCCFL